MASLEQIWRSKTDEELAEAARTIADYTAAGESTIRAELQRRGMPEPPPIRPSTSQGIASADLAGTDSPTATPIPEGWRDYPVENGQAHFECPACGQRHDVEIGQLDSLQLSGHKVIFADPTSNFLGYVGGFIVAGVLVGPLFLLIEGQAGTGIPLWVTASGLGVWYSVRPIIARLFAIRGEVRLFVCPNKLIAVSMASDGRVLAIGSQAPAS
jgi:hypothetical protein